MDDRETSPGEERGVREDEGSEEYVKKVRRRAKEEVSSSKNDEVDVEEMATDDEEELWRRVEMDGFQREEIEVGGRPDGFHREEDIDTTPRV